jgi:hypothetical protein
LASHEKGFRKKNNKFSRDASTLQKTHIKVGKSPVFLKTHVKFVGFGHCSTWVLRIESLRTHGLEIFTAQKTANLSWNGPTKTHALMAFWKHNMSTFNNGLGTSNGIPSGKLT